MQTSVTKRGQTVIPADIRKHYQIKAGDKLVWLEDKSGIKVIPISSDPITALKGRGKGEKLVKKLLIDRQQDRERES